MLQISEHVHCELSDITEVVPILQENPLVVDQASGYIAYDSRLARTRRSANVKILMSSGLLK